MLRSWWVFGKSVHGGVENVIKQSICCVFPTFNILLVVAMQDGGGRGRWYTCKLMLTFAPEPITDQKYLVPSFSLPLSFFLSKFRT